MAVVKGRPLATITAVDEGHFRKLERMYAAAPINAWFGPTLSVAEGAAEIRIPLRSEFHHAAGAVHGAVYFKALDDATFFAASSVVQEVFVLTAHFEIDLLRPVVAGELRAVARVTERGERRILAEGDLFDGEGNIVARGRGSFAKSKIPLTPALNYA
ncbi:MAG TPA: PaaI family thioesterase [Polyangiaceae bacterium]